MVEYLAPKKVCPTWYYILSHLAFEWKNGNETSLHSDKQSNPWAVWVEKSIEENYHLDDAVSWMVAAKKSHPTLLLPEWIVWDERSIDEHFGVCGSAAIVD